MAYYIGSCPICRQGILEVVKDTATGIIYICCDDCEAEWNNTEDAMKGRNGTRGKYGLISYPTLEEIIKIGWEKYLKNIT